MYDYISGKVSDLSPTELILDNQGIGYSILISLQTYSALQGKESVKIYIYHHLHEDDELLYGFAEKKERYIFKLLISVSGIGPSTARMMLSSLSTEEIINALISGDVNKIKSVKGIGLKTAQKAIIELKDKVSKVSHTEGTLIPLGNNPQRDEAMSALVLLGFGKTSVEKVLDTILKKDSNSSLEDLIKKALKLL